jgi:formate hydrogenlyase subunit 3/multisubunit Na+/H+ antiporter MnhD subunit
MQFLIIVLPFVMTAFIIGFEWVLSPARFAISRRLMIVWPTVTLAAMTTLLWLPGTTSDTGTFEFSALAKLFLTLLFVLTGVAVLAAYPVGLLSTGRFAPVALSVCGALQAALYLTNPFLITLAFVVASAFSIVALVDVAGSTEERFVKSVRSAVRYLIASVLFGLVLFIGLVFLERLRLDPQLTGLIKVAVAMLAVGFALRLAVFPFNLWLPEMLEEVTGLAGFLTVGLINVAATVFLMDFLQKNRTLIFDNYPEAQSVMLLGLVGAVLAGVLALAQTSLGKMIAYTVSSDYGLILFGIASPHTTGRNGAMFEAANLALLQLLIFTSLSVVYYCVRGSALEELRGLGRAMPVTAVGLMVGFLGMSGVPLLSGFAGKYLIIQSAAQEGLWLALAAGGAVAICVVAYLRFFHKLFMGEITPGLKTRPEPRGATALILALVVVVILIGLWPSPVLDWMNSALQGTF